MIKSKIWKAEKQEDLAFHGEGERIKFTLLHTTKKVAVVLFLFNSHKQNCIEQLINTLEPNEKVILKKFIKKVFQNNEASSSRDVNEEKNQSQQFHYMLESLNFSALDRIAAQNVPIETITDGAQFLIKMLDGLLKSFEIRLSLSASALQLQKQNLRRAWKEQKRYKEEIRGLRNELYGLKMAMKARVAAKKRRIRQQEDDIVELKMNCKNEIAQLCEKSEAGMQEAFLMSQERQVDLEGELQFAQGTLAELLQEHQITEKTLREEKRKEERKLEQTIELYDDTMFQLHAETEGTEAGYLDEYQQLQSLLVKFQAQEVLYNAAMAEKQREEQEELERQIQLFRRRVAAGKIQNCWRGYQMRKLERSKGKKGKKGRKKQSGNDKKK